MPRVTMFFDPTKENFGSELLHQIGLGVIPLVAQATSTEDVPLTNKDIEWIPQPYPPGSIISGRINFDIETIGFLSRKVKLNKETMLKLKEQILAFNCFATMKPEEISIWVKFYDADGVHV